MTNCVPPAAGATRIILVRHGEPDDSVRGRCYGRLDPGLSPRGREQMQRAWLLLHDEPLTAIYSSPRRRAVESASLRPTENPAVTVDDRLREIDFGAFEGLAYDEIAKRFPEKYEEWMSRPTEVSFPGGERFGEMSARVLEMSHGGTNRVVLAAALDLDPRRIFRLDQAYAGVNVIDYIGDEPLVRVINAIAPFPC
jgi:alpha-ribazole phosphatase/probable phosphoglycerate mutase